jgi:hypothetical protein
MHASFVSAVGSLHVPERLKDTLTDPNQGVDLLGLHQFLMPFGNLQKSFLQHIRRIDSSLESWIDPKTNDFLKPRSNRHEEFREFLQVPDMHTILTGRQWRAFQARLARGYIGYDRCFGIRHAEIIQRFDWAGNRIPKNLQSPKWILGPPRR